MITLKCLSELEILTKQNYSTINNKFHANKSENKVIKNIKM